MENDTKEKKNYSHGFRLPKSLPSFSAHQSEADEKSILSALRETSEGEFKIPEELFTAEEREAKPLEVNPNTSELMVITKAKHLATYIIAISEKAPKRFRVVFTNRLQNHALDILESLLSANFTRLDSNESKAERKAHQKQAFLKLKVLGFISFLAYASHALKKSQYSFIALNLSETVSMLVAWGKSDVKRTA
ncbi:MAG: four helix bundle protein [Firmicutes bacterium]|nr:four helix bundle protein [Bacillota bacterium]